MFRIGTTSYIIPAGILPNVRHLAGRVSDIQLVLFETDEQGSNLPDEALRCALRDEAARHGLSYTVHLPLDLRLADGGEAESRSLRQARRTIEATRGLDPYGYTLHLDATLLPPPWGACQSGALPLAIWREQAIRALAALSRWVPDPARLCIENLECADPDAFAPLFDRLPVSRTVDIGHLWLQGRDPVATLEAWLPRTRIVHMHGIGTRDHQSLRHVPRDRLVPLLRLLLDRFDGVLTLELFNESDLAESLDAVRAVLEEVPT